MFEYDWRDLFLSDYYYKEYGIVTLCDADELMVHEEREE